MNAISQLQLAYKPEEDRILMRVNTSKGEEYRFWLTRRYSLLLRKALREHRDKDPDVLSQTNEFAKQAVQEFKRDEAMAKGNFKEQFQQGEQLPLGEEPMLAFRLKYSYNQDNIELSISPQEGAGITLALDQQLNFLLSRLLNGAMTKAEWTQAEQGDFELIPANRVVN